jgi:excisionase family DNA binding protein
MAKTTDVLNAEEAAQLLRTSAWTVREEARRGNLPARKVGREWRFHRDAIVAWLRCQDEYDYEPLSEEEQADLHEALLSRERGESVSLDEYNRLRR